MDRAGERASKQGRQRHASAMATALRMAAAGGAAWLAVAPVQDWLRGEGGAEGLTRAQRDAALAVAHGDDVEPAVLAPCFLISARWVLGKVLGEVYAPIGPQRVPAVARFVLDLATGALVEARAYGADGVVYAAHVRATKEYVWAGERAELGYQRADGTPLSLSPDAPPSWPAFRSSYGAYLPEGDVRAVALGGRGGARIESIVVHLEHPLVARYAIPDRPSVPPFRSASHTPRRLLPRPPG